MGPFDITTHSAFPICLDPVYGYKVSITVSSEEETPFTPEPDLPIGSVWFDRITLLPECNERMTVAWVAAEELIQVPCDRCPVYYQSPNSTDGWQTIPESLRSAPLMDDETYSWREHLSRIAAQNETSIRPQPDRRWSRLAQVFSLIGSRIAHPFAMDDHEPTVQSGRHQTLKAELASLPSIESSTRSLPPWLLESLRSPQDGSRLHLRRTGGRSELVDEGGFTFSVHANIPRLLSPTPEPHQT